MMRGAVNRGHLKILLGLLLNRNKNDRAPARATRGRVGHLRQQAHDAQARARDDGEGGRGRDFRRDFRSCSGEPSQREAPGR